MFDEEQHILRYWEREFTSLNPSKNRAGNRVYTEKDIRVLKVIKKLLRIDRMPVVAAKEALKNGISDDLALQAESVVQLAPVKSVSESVEPDIEIGQTEHQVQLRKADVGQVVGILREVADLIDRL